MNISGDLYVDRPTSVVEILHMKEDHQTGQEHPRLGSQDKITQVPEHTRKPAQSGQDNNHTHTPSVNEYQW